MDQSEAVSHPQPLVDVGNELLTQVQARLDTGSLATPGGKTGVVTIRTASTTLTVFIGTADLRNWASLLSELADEMSGGLVPATAADVAAVNQSPLEHRRR